MTKLTGNVTNATKTNQNVKLLNQILFIILYLLIY